MVLWFFRIYVLVFGFDFMYVYILIYTYIKQKNYISSANLWTRPVDMCFLRALWRKGEKFKLRENKEDYFGSHYFGGLFDLKPWVCHACTDTHIFTHTHNTMLPGRYLFLAQTQTTQMPVFVFKISIMLILLCYRYHSKWFVYINHQNSYIMIPIFTYSNEGRVVVIHLSFTQVSSWKTKP